MAVVLNGTTNDITVNGVSVSTKQYTDERSPTGTIITFVKNTAPAGYLKCNGSAISRTAYAALFAVIGTTFGTGDGSTTFNLPDLRGYFARGWDDGRGIDTGRVFGSSQEDDFKSHSHIWNGGGNVQLVNAGGINVPATGWNGNTSMTGGTETRPKNIALLYCIKY